MKQNQIVPTMVVALVCLLASIFHKQIRSTVGDGNLFVGLGAIIVVSLVGAWWQMKNQSREK